MARSGEGERAGEIGDGVRVTETSVADAIAPRVGEAVVGLGGGDGHDRQGSRGHREGRGVAGGLGEDVVAVVGDEAVAGHVVAADIAGGGGRRGEGQRTRRGGGKALSVDEAGDRAREGRIDQAILAGRGVRRDGQRGRGDRKATVGAAGEVVVVRSITGSARDDGVVADVARRGRDGGRAAGTGDTGGRQGLAVHEAGEGRRKGRVGGAIGANRIRGDHGQGGLVHRESGGRIGDRVVRAGEARAGDRVAARVDGVLGITTEDERAAEDGGVLAVDEAREGRALPAYVSQTIVGLAVRQQGDRQRLGRDHAVGGVRGAVDEVVARLGAGEAQAGEVVALARGYARGQEVGRAGGAHGIAREDAVQADLRGGIDRGTVVDLAGGGRQGLRGDRLDADDRRGAGEVRTRLTDTRSCDGIVTHRQEAGRGERAIRAEREGEAAVDSVDEGVSRAADGTERQRRKDITADGHVLDAADGVIRSRAIDVGRVGDLHEHPARRDDLVIAGDVVDRVVACRKTGGHEHSGIGAGRTGRGIATGDGQRSGKSGGGGILTGHEADVADAIEACCVALTDETSVGIRRDGERRRRDGRGGRSLLGEDVVGGSCAGEQGAREGHLAGGGDIRAVESPDDRATKRDRIGAEDAREDARARDRGGGGAVIGLRARSGETAHRERLRGDRRRDRRLDREGVVRSVRSAQGQPGEGDLGGRHDVLAVIGADGGAVEGDRIGSEDADERTRPADDGGRIAIIDLAGGDGEPRHRQRSRGDDRREAVRGGDDVVAGVGARDGEAGEAHGVRSGDVLAVIDTLRRTREAHAVGAKQTHESRRTSDDRGGRAVIDLAGRHGKAADRKLGRRDRAGEAGHSLKGIVTRISARKDDGGVRDDEGLARADVLVGEGGGDRRGIRGDRVS